MSAIGQREDTIGEAQPEESGECVRVPAVIDAHGDKIITLADKHGRSQTRLIAELVLEAFRGPCPSGHTLKFKNGNRLNCQLAYFEWATGSAAGDEAARVKAIATPERADAVRLKAAYTAIAPSCYARIGSDDEALQNGPFAGLVLWVEDGP